MKFVQLIEFKTDDIDAFNRTLDEWLAKTSGVRTPTGPPKAETGTMNEPMFTLLSFRPTRRRWRIRTDPRRPRSLRSWPSSVTLLRRFEIWTSSEKKRCSPLFPKSTLRCRWRRVAGASDHWICLHPTGTSGALRISTGLGDLRNQVGRSSRKTFS